MRSRASLADATLTVVLLAVFVGALLMSLGWPDQAALFPRLITGTGVGLALGHLAWLGLRGGWAGQSAPARDEKALERESEGDTDESEAVDLGYVFARVSTKAWMAALGWLALFYLVLWVFGIIAAFLLFTIPYLRLSGRSRWWVAALYAAAFTAIFYLAFVGLLRVPVPGGLT